MELSTIKSKVYLKGLKMKDLYKNLNVSRQLFYKKIKRKDKAFLKEIDIFLS